MCFLFFVVLSLTWRMDVLRRKHLLNGLIVTSSCKHGIIIECVHVCTLVVVGYWLLLVKHIPFWCLCGWFTPISICRWYIWPHRKLVGCLKSSRVLVRLRGLWVMFVLRCTVLRCTVLHALGTWDLILCCYLVVVTRQCRRITESSWTVLCVCGQQGALLPLVVACGRGSPCCCAALFPLVARSSVLSLCSPRCP